MDLVYLVLVLLYLISKGKLFLFENHLFQTQVDFVRIHTCLLQYVQIILYIHSIQLKLIIKEKCDYN